MAEIKVTIITTKKEETTTKLDAMFEAAVKAKAYADNVEAVKQPIINLAGEAKFDEIVRQLDEALERVKKVFTLTGNWDHCWNFGLVVLCSYSKDNLYFRVPGGTKIHAAKEKGLLPYLLKQYGLVPDWDKSHIIEKIDLELERELNRFIENQKEKAERISNTLDKILG